MLANLREAEDLPSMQPPVAPPARPSLPRLNEHDLSRADEGVIRTHTHTHTHTLTGDKLKEIPTQCGISLAFFFHLSFSFLPLIHSLQCSFFFHFIYLLFSFSLSLSMCLAFLLFNVFPVSFTSNSLLPSILSRFSLPFSFSYLHFDSLLSFFISFYFYFSLIQFSLI